jgi:twitching motility two-component system response regulator PilH
VPFTTAQTRLKYLYARSEVGTHFARAAAHADQPGRWTTSWARGVTEKVLLIDDNVAERGMFSALLYYNGYDVIEASTAPEGIELAKAQRPNVILMDVLLPGVDGLVATEILKSLPETADIPVVCLTGSTVTRENARVAGATELLRKPVLTSTLVNTVRRCCADYPVKRAESE